MTPRQAPAAEPVLDTILSRDDLVRLTGLHRQRIRQLVMSGEFPVPVKLTAHGRKVGWLSSEIRQWQLQAANNRRVQWTTGQPKARKGRRGP